MQDEEAAEQAVPANPEARTTGRRWVAWLPTTLLVLAVLAAVSGTVYWLVDRPSSNAVEIFIPTPTPERAPLVHVAGAVVSPGIYSLSADARVGDAIEMAGGALPGADTGALNLAAVVLDGQRIEVPVSPGRETVTAGGDDPVIAQGTASSTPGLIDLNTAGQPILETLPNIGPSRAKSIIDWREASGPFESLDSLRDVPGIGPETVSGLRGLVVPG